MSLKDDIIRTEKYAKSYGCKLNKQQVYGRLIGNKAHRQIFNFQFSIFNKQPKIQKAMKLAEMLGKKFKNILFIGVTGSVAAEFPKKNDDIDLFIITKNNTLWVTRFWVRIFVMLNKIPHRQYGKIEHKDEFCFNMWLDEIALKLPKNRQNLRNAVDLVLMKKLYDKNNIYARFLKANGWAKKWVATPYYRLTKFSIFNFQFSINFQLFNFLNNLIYFIPQYLYLKLKGQRDTTDLHRAMWGKGEDR